MNRKRWMKIVLVVAVIITMIIYCYPLLYLISTSLKTKSEFLLDPVGLVQNIRLQNYKEAWIEANLGTSIFNSLFYSTVCTVVSLLMALFLSYPLARNYHKFYSIIYMAFMMGMFLPDGTIPRWQMIFKAGLYNTRLGYMLTMIGGGGVTLLMFVSYVKSIPRDLDEAAVMDGCGYIRFVFKILIPLMKPALVSMAVLQAITVWNDVMNSILYLSNEKLYPITRGLYVFKGVYSINWPLLTAALVIVAIPMIILYVFLQKYIIDGIVAGGVKA